MDAGAFSDDEVVKSAEGFIRILADWGKHADLRTKYGISARPSVIFLDSEGKKVGQMASRDAKEVATQFTEISTKYQNGPKWVADADAALKQGKDEFRPVGLLFVDDGPKSRIFQNILGHPSFTKEILERISFAKVPYSKESDTCKKWKVRYAPTLLLIDNREGKEKVLRTVKGGSLGSILSKLVSAIKTVKKPKK